MTQTSKDELIDGKTIAEHREAGRAFGILMQYLDELSDSLYVSVERRFAYQRIRDMVDAALDGLSDITFEGFREHGVMPYPLFTIDGELLLEVDKANADEESAFTNHRGLDWFDVAEVFPLMCPATGRNCHSLCACYRDRRTKTTEIGTDLDYSYRVDGYTFGRCDHFGFVIGTD